MVLSSNPSMMTITNPQRRTTVQEFVENEHPDAVPDEYIIPEEERCKEITEINNMNLLSTSHTESTAIAAQLEIPLIDMEGISLESESGAGRRCVVVQQIQDACKEWGFFQVKNHGVPLPLMKQMQQVAREFLELPAEEKHDMHMKAVQKAVKGWIVEEGYSSKRATSEGGISHWSDRLRHCMFPISSRQYDMWPTYPPSFRKTMEDYYEEVQKLTRKLLELISESLGLSPSAINDYFGENYTENFQVNYYPPCPQPDLAMGLVKHSDVGSITLLLQDTTPGLQVLKDGKWVTVKPLEDFFVVNMGDQIEVATNGRYKSVEHRVYVSSQPRMSMAIFTYPSDEMDVGPLSELLGEEELPKYKQCSYREYKKSYMGVYYGSWRKRLSGKEHLHSFMTQTELLST